MARCDQDVAEDAVPVELEAAVDRAHLVHARAHEGIVPAAALALLVDVREELVDGRVVTIEQRLDERPGRAPPPRGAQCESGKRRRQTVAVALRAHLALPDRGRPPAPHGRGIVLRSEDDDVVNPTMPQRQVCGEAREPAADDCRAHYLTEPASRPCTK